MGGPFKRTFSKEVTRLEKATEAVRNRVKRQGSGAGGRSIACRNFAQDAAEG
jgi:hypothetical protein